MSNPAQGASVSSVFLFDAQQVRLLTDGQNNPLFCAKDVCSVLGYANDTDTISEGVVKRYLRSGNQSRALIFLSEGNLYRLILKSHKPEAERFETWVCDEVLPQICKAGRYATSSANPMSD